jgi:Arc/MetJ-type ribon-helix-helix transcriptional regulator
MNINLKLSGVVEDIIEEMIAKGYASNKTEAIRLAVLDYKHHHLKEEKMTREEMQEFEEALKEYKEGKTISLEEV